MPAHRKTSAHLDKPKQHMDKQWQERPAPTTTTRYSNLLMKRWENTWQTKREETESGEQKKGQNGKCAVVPPSENK